MFPAKNRILGLGRSLPTESVICTSVEPQPFSNYETNKISDKSTNVNPTSTNSLCDDYPAVENKNRQTATFSTPICCHISANQIDNHKSITSSEHKHSVHYLDVVGKNQNKRKNRRLSPTQHHHHHHLNSNHQTECECKSLHTRKPSENTTSKPCHSENRKIIKVAHKFNSNGVHSIGGDQSWVDANDVNSPSDFHVNKPKFHCLDYDQCCFCCYSECKKGSRSKATNYKCDDQSVECSQPYRNLSSNLCCIGNDTNAQTHLNNNCKLYKNQNNDQNSYCKSDTTTETDILEVKKSLVHDNSYQSAQFYVDYAIQPSNLRHSSDKSAKSQKRKTDPIAIINQTPLNYLRRVQSINENCSDCIGQLDKTFIKQLKRLQSADYGPRSLPNSIETSPIVQEDQQKLVCCSKNVTAVRKTATLFMIGSDSSTLVGSKPKLKDKSELVRDDLVDTCQNSENNNEFKTQYNRKIDRCCEPHKSIDSKNQLTSISPAKESHSKTENRNQIINYKIRADRTHKHLKSDCDENRSTNSTRNRQRNEQKQQQRQQHNGNNDTFGHEGVNGDNDEYLCHLEKLNLADTTTAGSVTTTEQFKQKVAHISSTYRDNDYDDGDDGATTTHTTAAPSLTVENELFAVDKSKQSEYQVNSIECTDQSAITTNDQCKIIESNEQSVEEIGKSNEFKSELNISNDINDENTDFSSSGNILIDENLVLSANTEDISNEECILFEHKPIRSILDNPNRLLNRRASFDNCVEKDLAIFVNHRRTNSSGGEGYSFDRTSNLNRSYIDSISDRYRYIQNTDHRYAHYLTPNTVSSEVQTHVGTELVQSILFYCEIKCFPSVLRLILVSKFRFMSNLM